MSEENKLTGLFNGKKIEIAPQEDTESYQYELEEILGIIGHPEAFITDLSMFGDFDPEDETLEQIGNNFGIDTPKQSDYLVSIAKLGRKARKGIK